MRSQTLPLLLVVVLLASPAATAFPQPSVYYLKDGPLGPAGDGALESTPGNATQPNLRLVPLGTEEVLPVQFLTPANLTHPDRLLGTALVAVWLGPSVVVKGNLTVVLSVVAANGTRPLASATTLIDFNASRAPDPATLVPPNPADPQGSAAYLLSKLLPLVVAPPVVLSLGRLDANVSASDRLALSFELSQGSSPGPVAAGAFASVQYNATLNPSLLYVPWYAPDPPRPPPPPPRTTLPPPTTPGGTSASPTHESAGPASVTPSSGKSKGIPGPDAALALVAAALVALAWRRRP